MITLRLRLIIGYLIVLLVGMVIAASLAWLAIERLYLDTQRANLLAQAELAAAALRDAPAFPADPYSQSTNILPGIHTHILDLPAPAGGDIAVGAPEDLAQRGGVAPGELLTRPEIVAALAGTPETAVRAPVIANGRRVLYAAAPVIDADGGISRLVYIASPLPATSWEALPIEVRLQLIGALLVALCAAAAAGWWLARGIARPLHVLADAARQVAAGDLTRTVEPDRGAAELYALGNSFNRMTAGLRRADELKAAFIADVGHELRTPLTIIKGTVETLQDGAIDDPAVRDSFLASVAAETERLIRLVNDLLVLTRAEAGMLALEPEPFHIDELAQTRAARFAPLADRNGVCIELVYERETEPLACVLADPQRITQVLDNLLANALRHTPPGGRITIALAHEPDMVRCSVADTGGGIAAQHLPHIFERFYRADKARSRTHGGSGLGLSICRALIHAHNGTITLESAENRGTSVTFRLPRTHCP